ncbi:MAG: MmcQ/YjbR family DNA-binding protein [Pseudomonadota bacterium]
MTPSHFNAFCGALGPTTHVVQWGGAHVWKIGGKVFAIGGWDKDDAAHRADADFLSVTFKCSELSYDLLRSEPGCRPAPYLASRGMKWIQRTSDETLDDAGLEDYLRESFRLVALKLTKARRRELGLETTR